MLKSRNGMKDEDFIRNIEEYKDDYMTLDKDRLVLFAVNFLKSNNIEPTFDKIVATAFRLFPKKFGLIGFPEYPDGRTIYYCVYNHCTITRKWLLGNVQSGFMLTDRGKYYLDETRKILDGKIKLKRKYSTVARRKELTFLNLLKKTSAYKKFESGKQDEIREYEIYEALKINKQSKVLMKQHLQKYLEYADRINDDGAKRFLDFLWAKGGV